MPRVLCAGRRRVPTKAAGSPAPWAVWLAAPLGPASVARWAPSTACSEFPIAAIAAAAITTATVVSAVIADQLAVIASDEAIHSHKTRLDCFVAEPVIGRAFARPVGLAMTKE